MAQIKKKNTEFFLRALSSILLVPIIICIILKGGIYFSAFIIIIAIIMGGEWAIITKSKPEIIWQIIGILYIGLPCISLIYLAQEEKGYATILSIFSIVIATNCGGYIFGKLLKGPKLAPKISPNKTWTGFFGGIFLAILAGIIRKEEIYFVIIISIIAQIGDLLESWIKRKFHVKDSGNIIPGHGGLIDEFDGIVLVAPLIAILQLLGK
jgi:phosphatidate cytidylyltransferase